LRPQTQETEPALALIEDQTQGEGGVHVRTPPSFASIASEGLLLFLLCILPVAINPFGVLAVEPLKSSLLRGTAALLAATWLAHRFTGRPGVDVGAHPVVRTGLALVGLAAVSTVLSLDATLSFFGSFDRGMGWLSLGADAVLLVVSADLLSDSDRRERALTALLVGAIVPCGYMLLQRVGIDPINWQARGAPGSTLGSPTFLGGYLVIVAPFAAYRVVTMARAALSGRQSLAYASYLALLLIVCAVVLLTTIRAPLLGLGMGLVTFAALSRGRWQLGRGELVAAAAVLVVGVGVALATAGGGGLRSFERFSTIGGAVDSSSLRLTVWQDSVATLVGDPRRLLIGYGDDMQAVVFEHREAIVRRTPVELWDRAHNVLLDTWLVHGLVGMVALVALVWFALRSAWRGRAGGSLLAAAVLAALVGHLVEVFFAFHSVTTGALFWVLLGFAASFTPRRLGKPATCDRQMAILGVASAVLLMPLLVTPAVADWLYGTARRSNFEVGARLEEQAAAWVPWIEELPRAAGLDWQQVSNRRRDGEAAARAEQDLLEAARRAPFAPEPQVRLTRLYLGRADADLAEAACQRAIANGPYRATVWDACAQVSEQRGLAVEAAERRARADAVRQPAT
jgi:O-antigen ligase